MCRRALYPKMKFTMNDDYHEKKAARMRKNQVIDCTRPAFPVPPPPPPAPAPSSPKPQQPKIKPKCNQISIESNVVVTFS